MKKAITIFVFIFSVSANQLFAGGFQINEHGARAMGLAGAFTALANDPSAIHFNPAGITQLSGTRFSLGATLISPSTTFKGPNPLTTETDMESQLFTPFNVYITHQFSDKLFAGFGVNNPYGLGTKWAETWAGRYLAVETEIRSFFFTPVVAYKLSDNFSISAGAQYAFADVKILRNIPLRDPVTGAVKPDAEIDMEGDGTAWGFTVGALYKPVEQLAIGVNYRSEVKIDFEGTATTTPPALTFTHPLAGPQSIPLPYGNITAPLTTPQNLQAGLAYYASDKLTLAADFQYIGWSSYDKLEVTFETYKDPTTGSSVSSAKRDYENTYIIRAGGEYLASEKFTLRAGVLYDNNPVKDEYVEPTLPDANRIGLNVGFGYHFSQNLSIDVAYLFLMFAEREISTSVYGFNGTYTSNAHLFGLNFNYNL